MHFAFFALALLALVLTRFAPALVRLRIRFLRWLGWTWAVNLFERHFDLWVLVVRVALALVAVLMFVLGLRGA